MCLFGLVLYAKRGGTQGTQDAKSFHALGGSESKDRSICTEDEGLCACIKESENQKHRCNALNSKLHIYRDSTLKLVHAINLTVTAEILMTIEKP
jgi:hypothetical protein